MKIVIIGGGISGLATGIYLQNKGIVTVVFEKRTRYHLKGTAFLLNKDALIILEELAKDDFLLKRNKLDTFTLKNPKGDTVNKKDLVNWNCVKRVDLIHYLYDLYTNEVKFNKKFSHFIYKEGKSIAAVFSDGTIEYGDVFIGCDGGNSHVRSSIFKSIKKSPTQIKEIVGLCTFKKVPSIYKNQFTKFQHQSKGLSFGYIPTFENNELVWFIQFDCTFFDWSSSNSVKELKSLSLKMMENFPTEVRDIIRSTNFDQTYLWNTWDFDSLPLFHKDNIVVIGDAAHKTLPFTSTGTSSALQDAKMISTLLSPKIDIDISFSLFYKLRIDSVLSNLKEGRTLKQQFLRPLLSDNSNKLLPLVQNYKADNKIKILHFTDPICSTCWSMQSVFKKLEHEYGDYIDTTYFMGGLLPSWDLYNKAEKKQKITNHIDVSKHWDEVCITCSIPGTGDVWLEDPLHSSYPPSVAFKAAQLQCTSKANRFLRRLREVVFLEKTNIEKIDNLVLIARSVGLDIEIFLADIQGTALSAFNDDLTLVKKIGIHSFPTLILYTDDFESHILIKGKQRYDEIEKIICSLLPDIKKNSDLVSPLCLFEKYISLTTLEVSVVCTIDFFEAEKILTNLFIEKRIDKKGKVWLRRSM